MRLRTHPLLGFALLFSLIGVLAVAQSSPEAEITAEPSHHLLLQNRWARAFYEELAPGAATLVHRHRHDYVYVTLGAAELTNEVVGKAADHRKLQDGQTVFVEGGFAHRVRNLAGVPFRSVIVELLQDAKARKSPPAKWDEDRGLQVLEGGTQDILFVKDGVRVSEVDLQAGGMLPGDNKAAPRLLVAVSAVNLRGHGSDTNVHIKPGEVSWIAGAPTLMNMEKGSCKLIVLEFR